MLYFSCQIICGCKFCWRIGLRQGQANFVLRGGRIILSTRADDKHGVWQCRLRVGSGNKLIRRSTKTTDLAEARVVADELYEELRFKQRHGPTSQQATFQQVANTYLQKVEREVRERRLSKGRLVLVAGTLRRYLLPFFAKRPINEISQTDFTDYDDWRLSYWADGYGADDRKANAALVPAQKTLVMEQSVLRQVFRHAVEQGYLEQLPYMAPKRSRTNRRSAFSVEEYRRLIQAARTGAREAKHPRVQRDRRLLELYVRLLVHSGLRVGELRALKWSDAELTAVANGRVREALRLWVNGKTGKRAVIAAAPARRVVRQLLAFYGYGSLAQARESGRPIFERSPGEPIHTFEVGFKALLKRAGLQKDRYGANRTLYCCRHTYATFRLLYGGTDVYLLARNMGTSVAMIEQHYGHVTTTLAAERLV